MRGSESTVQELSDLVEKLMPKDGNLDVDFIHVQVYKPDTWEASVKSLPNWQERKAEQNLMRMNEFVYFVSDFLTWMEYGQMMPNTFHH